MMAGPTLFGWIVIIAYVALIGFMGWLGWRKKWLVGLLLTVPFLAWLAYEEATTMGPPIYEDPYGPMMAIIILGPIAVGWIVFLVSRVVRLLRRNNSLRS